MRRMRIVISVLILGLILFAGMILTNPTSAQNDPTWLAFDGYSKPSKPEMRLVSADASMIELQATLPGVYVDAVTAEGDLYTRMSGDGYGYPYSYGLPELPVLRQEVEIPFGAEVSVELISSQSMNRSLATLGLHPIYPMQPPVPKVEGVEDNQPFTIDSKYYTDGSMYPAWVVNLGEPYVVRGHRILPVEVWPVSYDPSVGSLRLYSQVVFRLNLTGSDMVTTEQLANRYSSPSFDPSISGRVLNFNQGQPQSTKGDIGLLIISADAYVDALAPLVTLRENRGFEVTLARTSEIPNGNTPAGIKSYIQTAYDTWPLPPSYILLVGDTDTLPTWTGSIIGTSTDLYYATMDGTSDWHPDIGRGRFPVRSVAQTNYMVDKYLEYAALNGQEPWLKTASFPATCDNYTVAEGTHNYVIDSYTAPGGWTGTFPVDPNPGGDKLYCVTYGASYQDLLDQFNQGRWAIIYSGHGSYSGWEMDYSPADIRNLTAYNMYPFVASHACLSGDFGQAEVFGETWVLQEEKGALVYWGSSTYSYWGEDDVLERSMFDSLFIDMSPHADVTVMTYAGLAAVEEHYPSSARYYWETYNILGDPSVHLFMEPDLPSFTFTLEPTNLEVCSEGTVESIAEIGSILGYSSTVYLENGELPFNVALDFDPAQSEAPFTSTVSLDISAGAPAGDHSIVITATDQVSLTEDMQINLRINTELPTNPILLSPEDGAVNQPVIPTFDWDDLPLVSRYNFELATSPLFESPLDATYGLSASAYTLADPLEGGKCYWWRAQAENSCGPGIWTEPFHFNTLDMGVSFSDAMESGEGQWSHQATLGADHWIISAAQSHSPTHAWFVPDDAVITDSRLWNTNPILVGEGSSLVFWHRYQFEGDNYDGAVLELSSDGGESWSDLGEHITDNGYNGTISSSYSNPLANRQAWTAVLTTWTEVTVDLGSFAGQEVIIRWRLGCDTSVGDTGWFIDDVQVFTPLPPNPAPALFSVAPGSGSNDAPITVLISGTGFLEGAAVRLGETWLISTTVTSPSTIEAVIPAGLPVGIYDLTLINGDCQPVTLEDAFELLLPTPPYHYIYLPLTSK